MIQRQLCKTIENKLFSGKAIEKIQDSAIEELVILNTIPLPEEKQIDKIKVISVGSLFAETLMRIHENESISKLFEGHRF